MFKEDRCEDEEGDLTPMENRKSTKVVEESPSGRFVRFNDKLWEGSLNRKVYRAWDTTNGIEVAWNSIAVGLLSQSEAKRVIQEMKILQNLHHANIIKFCGSWLNKETQGVVFVTELITSGSLKEFAEGRPVRLNILKRWCTDILKGLEYLHNHTPKIIHRDLTLEKLFINGCSGDIRIGELGLASWRIGDEEKAASDDTDKERSCTSIISTLRPEYMAPELYNEAYDEQVDIYAFGMCVLELVTKQVPYAECSSKREIMTNVMNGILPLAFLQLTECPVKDFIYKCIRKPESGEIRPSAQELLEDCFLIPDDEESGNVDCESLVSVDTAPPVFVSSVSSNSSISSSKEGEEEEEEGVVDISNSRSGSERSLQLDDIEVDEEIVTVTTMVLHEGEQQQQQQKDTVIVENRTTSLHQHQQQTVYQVEVETSVLSASAISTIAESTEESEMVEIIQDGTNNNENGVGTTGSLSSSSVSPTSCTSTTSAYSNNSEREESTSKPRRGSGPDWVCTAHPNLLKREAIDVKLRFQKVCICFEFNYNENARETIQEMINEGCVPSSLPQEDIEALTAQLEHFKEKFASVASFSRSSLPQPPPPVRPHTLNRSRSVSERSLPAMSPDEEDRPPMLNRHKRSESDDRLPVASKKELQREQIRLKRQLEKNRAKSRIQAESTLLEKKLESFLYEDPQQKQQQKQQQSPFVCAAAAGTVSVNNQNHELPYRARRNTLPI